MSDKVNKIVIELLRKVEEIDEAIPWGSPIVSFGDINKARIATLGLNPSNREFVDVNGKELGLKERRFETLKSLELDKWSHANTKHIEMINDSCYRYFSSNPYDVWFNSLDKIISGASYSYYCDKNIACHLDLVPFATNKKWGELSRSQKFRLLELSCDSLGKLVMVSNIQALVLNGVSVIDLLQRVSDFNFVKSEVKSWALPRKTGKDVKGYSYKGYISQISGIKLKKSILVLGYNHNIQSSFGVTNKVRSSIKRWMTINLRVL